MMRYSKAHLRVVAMVLIAVMGLELGCGSIVENPPDDQGSPATERVARATYTGRELYAGMFFGAGSAAQLFPELWENESVKARMQQVTSEVDFAKIATDLADKIAEQDPAFFERFSAGIQSGDHLTIAATLKDAREHTRRAALGLGDISSSKIQRLVGNDSLSSDVYLYWETAVAVAVVAVVILFAIDITPVAEATTGGSHLSMDTWVDVLAHKDFGRVAG